VLSSFTVLLRLCGHVAGALLLGQSEQAGLASFAAAATLVLVTGLITTTLLTAGLLSSCTTHAGRDWALRRRAFRTAYLPQRDPDARGRRRPRAPGAAPAAA
jgi:hypothetical protein